MSDSSSESGVSRRTVLKTVGVAAATPAAANTVSGRINADQELCEKYAEIDRRYNKVDVVMEAIKDHEEFFEALSESGRPLDSVPSVSSLMNEEAYIPADEGAHVWAINKSNSVEPTPHITIRRKGPNGGRISIALKPSDLEEPPIVLHKESIPELGGSAVEATLYQPGGEAKNRITEQKRPVVPHNIKDLKEDPDTLDELLGEESIPGTDGITTDNVGIQGLPYGCITKGVGCGSFACWLWEVACDPCRKIDCTGNRCCGGCCCCDDLHFCCSDCYGEPDGCSGCSDNPYGCADCSC